MRGISIAAKLCLIGMVSYPLFVHAQTKGGFQETEYEKAVFGLKQWIKAAIDKVGNASGESEQIVPLFGTVNSVCEGGKSDDEEACVTKDELKMVNMKVGQRAASVHALLPGRGLTDMMKADAIADQRSELLDSKNALLNITWNMVEPAVAAGMHNAMIQSEQGLTNRYMSELAFISQINSRPMMRELVGDPYFSCVANRMTEGQGAQGGGKGWVEAMAICMGDSLKKDDGKEFEKIEGDPYGYPDSPDKSKSGGAGGKSAATLRQSASGGRSPNECEKISEKYADQVCGESASGSTGASSTQDRICITDYIINQEEDSEQAKNFKAHWHRWVGDTVFIFSKEPKDGVREHCFKALYPKEDAGPAKIYGEFAYHRYKKLTNLLNQYCRHVGGRRNNWTGTGDGWETAFIADPHFGNSGSSENFWHKNKDEDWWAYLSVPGFQFSAGFADALFEYFDRAYEIGGGITATSRCSALLPASRGADPRKWGTGSDAADPKDIKDFSRLYWWYAQKIAEADVILMLRRMVKFMTQLSHGRYMPEDNVIRAHAINQILNAAGTDDLDGYYSRVISELHSMKEHVFGVRTSEIGNAAAVLNNLKREGDSSGSSSFNPLRD